MDIEIGRQFVLFGSCHFCNVDRQFVLFSTMSQNAKCFKQSLDKNSNMDNPSECRILTLAVGTRLCAQYHYKHSKSVFIYINASVIEFSFIFLIFLMPYLDSNTSFGHLTVIYIKFSSQTCFNNCRNCLIH